ncbi:MAG: hypothetical protein AAGB14_10465, partial [Verrucomicrobiota bacterium]
MKLRIAFVLLPAVSAVAGDLPSSSKAPLPAAKAALVGQDVPSRWQFGTGLMWRRIGEVSVTPNLQRGGLADRFFTPNPAAGPANEPADRSYDDGFVNQGAATPGTGLTSFWGYQEDSQVSGDSLSYSLAGGLALDSPLPGRDDADSEPAPFVEISYMVPVREGLWAGMASNFSFLGLDGIVASRMGSSDVTTVDVFPLDGVIPPIAPYSGTFSGPGPLIPNLPANRSFRIDPNGGSTGYLFGADADLYSLAFGGKLRWDNGDRCFLSLGAGVVINYADWDASWRATLLNPDVPGFSSVGAANSDRDFLLGAYLTAGAGFQIDENWSLEGFFR